MADNIAGYQHELETRDTWLKILEAGITILVGIVGLLGNFLVCWALYNSTRLRTIPNMFVASLAISDIAMTLVNLPLNVNTLVKSEWTFSKSTCHFQGYIIFTFGMASLHTLMAISVNRYFVVVRPNDYKRIFTKQRTFQIILIVWLVAFLTPLPPMLVPSMIYQFHPGKAICMYFFESNVIYTLFLEIVFIGTPMNIMIACYQKVFKCVRQNRQRVAAMRSQDRGVLTANIEEAKVTNSLAVVLVGFMSCWLPIGVIDVYDLVQGEPDLPRQVYFLHIFLVYLSCSLNPFIYGIMNKRFRDEYKQLVTCGGKLSCKERVVVETSSIEVTNTNG